MNNGIEAIYEHGVLRPLSKLSIAEGKRVIITIHPLPKKAEEVDAIYVRILLKDIKKHSIFY